jgi:hypothetical protein
VLALYATVACSACFTRQLISPESSEELAHVADEKVGLLHCGEMAAALEFGPVHDVVIAFCEPANGDVVPGEDRDASWCGATLLRCPCRRIMVGLVVELCRGAGGAREPTQRDVG